MTVNPGVAWCGVVWRVGYRPQPWAWTPWQYVGDTGRFAGRWDDPPGSFRTLRRANLLSCLLEVLAGFRLDPLPGEDLAGIVEDPADAQLYPTQPPGTVPLSWLTPRQVSTATLSGTFCAVTDIESVAAHAAGRISLDRTPVRPGRSGRRCAALQPGCDALGQ